MSFLVHALIGMVSALAGRLRRESGQTAAEYLGIIVVVALVIGAIYGSSFAADVASNVVALVAEIFGGGRGG